MSTARYYMAVLLLFSNCFLLAQQVLYSPYIDERQTARFDVIGKSGNFYWIQKNQDKNKVTLPSMPWTSDEQSLFSIFDSRMNLVNETPSFTISSNTLKEYFICGDEYFDLLVLTTNASGTNILLRRYSSSGILIINDSLIARFPFAENGNSFLLLRSENKQKILLLAFESIPSSPPRLHSLLFDDNWKTLSAWSYEKLFLSQPFLQYEFFNYPVEQFDNAPVKLANSGQWLMLTPSRQSNHFSLFHFNGLDSSFIAREIKTTSNISVEQVTLSIDNNNGDAYTGILSRINYPALKNADVAHYSFASHKVDFDSSYRFNTLLADKVKNQNLVEEDFLPVPGKGFLLLKEYGKNVGDVFHDRERTDYSSDPLVFSGNDIVTNTDIKIPLNKNDYTRYTTLAGPRSNYSRGDLSLFYFPANRQDSCWSGIINQEQTTELNSSYLSYLAIAAGDKMYFLYNSYFKNRRQFANTTTLDYKGNPLNDEGFVFWKTKNTLAFQKARQIASNEVAIPYDDYRRNGFAIIRFHNE